MTLVALLEELRDADPGTHDEYFKLVEKTSLDHWPIVLADPETHEYSPESEIIYNSIVQGCIQRACERREWPFHVAYYPPEGPNAPYYEAYIWPALKCHTAQADTAAEALLAAYITAVRAGAKR